MLRGPGCDINSFPASIRATSRVLRRQADPTPGVNKQQRLTPRNRSSIRGLKDGAWPPGLRRSLYFTLLVTLLKTRARVFTHPLTSTALDHASETSQGVLKPGSLEGHLLWTPLIAAESYWLRSLGACSLCVDLFPHPHSSSLCGHCHFSSSHAGMARWCRGYWARLRPGNLI